MPRNSTNDVGGIVYRYLHPVLYRQIAIERLERDRGLLSPAYRELLEKQIADCDREALKKNRTNSIISKPLFLG